MDQRGLITNPERARQLKDFRGLRFGTITPTDIDGLTQIVLPTLTIDGLIEYQQKGYVFIELKLGGVPLKDGQRKALERLHDDLWRADRPTLCIIAEHTTHDHRQSIDVAKAIVSLYRQNTPWMAGNGMTTRELIGRFLVWLNW